VAVLDPYQILQVAPSAEQEVVDAAYRALARKYHPDRDHTAYAGHRMAQLNAAYALVRDPKARTQWDKTKNAPMGPPVRDPVTGAAIPVPPPSTTGGGRGTRLEFGRYAGWTLRDIGRHDPDYLRWLSRHASGMRYRTEIYQILGSLGKPAA
jgi:curved DNA-binding protein CbpA